MRRSRGLAAGGVLVVLLGGLLGATLWPEQQQVQRTRALVAATLIAPGDALSEENVVWVQFQGPVPMPVLTAGVEATQGLVAAVDIPGGTLLHQGLLVSLEEAQDAAGRSVVEMPRELLPQRAVPGSVVTLIEVPSLQTQELLNSCGTYLYELRRVSVEVTGLPDEVPVMGSAQACEAAEASWSLPERIGAGPLVGGRDCAVELAAVQSDSTISKRFTRVAELSGAASEKAVAEAEAMAAGDYGEQVGRDMKVRLAAVSAEIAEEALADFENTHEFLGAVGAAETAELVRGLITLAEDDWAAIASNGASAAQVEQSALQNARAQVEQSAADEAAALPHRCVEEEPVAWPSGTGALEVKVIALREALAEIAVDSASVTGVMEVIREGRVVSFVGAVGGSDGSG